LDLGVPPDLVVPLDLASEVPLLPPDLVVSVPPVPLAALGSVLVLLVVDLVSVEVVVLVLPVLQVASVSALLVPLAVDLDSVELVVVLVVLVALPAALPLAGLRVLRLAQLPLDSGDN